MIILTDSQSAQNLANSTVDLNNKYSRHILQRVSWFKELIRDGSIRVNFIPGQDNIADIFTKILGRLKFKQFRYSLQHGDRRTFRNLAMMCMMQYLHDLPNPSLNIPLHYCNCHQSSSYKCVTVEENYCLLHFTPKFS